MITVYRISFIFLAVVMTLQADAREIVEVGDLFDYAFSEGAAAGEAGEAGEGEGYVPGGEAEERPGVNTFLRDTAMDYAFVWAARFFYVRNKNSKIFDISLSKWWDNVTTFPEWPDGDSFVTNWVTHPVIGSIQYLYYREMGHGFWASALGSLVQSFLWEYTVEGPSQPPSLEDLVSTTFVGVPVGVALEESSDWLVSTDFVPAKMLGHILNPMKNFIRDRQLGIYNPLSETFMTISGPIEFASSRKEAIDLSYPFFLEEPLPSGRFGADLELVNLKKELGSGQFVFYSVRVDVPSKSGLWGLYVQIAQSGINSVSIDGEQQRDGFEFANLLAGGKALLWKSRKSAVSGGMSLILPTSYKDNIDRLSTVTMFRRNFPINLRKAWTVTPYISAAAWKGVFSIQAAAGTDWVFNAGELEGNAFEFRLNYGTAAGVNIPAPASPVLFAELNGYSLLTADTFKKNDLFVTSGVRFGRKYSPGFAVQFPIAGVDKRIDRWSYIFDFQVRL